MYGVNSGSGDARRNVQELHQIISKLSLTDLNRVLFHCDQEEQDEGNGGGVYNVPNYGPLVYCGLQGEVLTSNCELRKVRNTSYNATNSVEILVDSFVTIVDEHFDV